MEVWVRLRHGLFVHSIALRAGVVAGCLFTEAEYGVTGDLTIANGSSTVAVAGADINIIGNIAVAPVIGGRAIISNGNNLLNDIDVDPMVFAGDASFTNGDSPANAIDVDDTTFTGTGATIKFTNGSGANNDINLGVTTANTFAGQVFAFNNSAVAGNNDIRVPQGVFGRNVTLSNGLNAAAGIAVINTVALATAGTGVDLTGNLVISNANTSGAGANSVNIGTAATTATNGLRVIQVSPANGSGSGNVNITNGTSATGAASVNILGADATGTVAGSTHALDGNLSVRNNGATAGGTKTITLSGLSTFGRTGATLNNAGAGDSTTNVGVVATVDPVFFSGTGGLFVQDGSGASNLNIQLATIGTLGTANQLGFRYQDMGGGTDTINVSTVAGSAVTVNGVTRLDTAGGGDIVTFTGAGSGPAAFNDSVFIALGAGNDTLNIGAFAASPAFGSASRFQFDGGQGVNTINASPLSISQYTVGNVPAKLRSKITGFRNINGALP